MPEPIWQEGAGSLLLLAAAHETGLLSTLEHALPAGAATPPRLAQTSPKTRRQSLLTLLFLPAVGLQRTRNLRGYTGDALALLTGRRRAYGYWWVECFLSQVDCGGGAESLTDALARWTTRLWQADEREPGTPPPAFYVDGHKKPVYSDHLIPRGLIGRTGKVRGCRALLLLHDAAGHPLLALTFRGDLHLTTGVPTLLERYEQAAAAPFLARLIVDREGMAAEFLAAMAAQGRTVVTVLCSHQYQGLASFTEVDDFVPLCWDCQGQVVQEVAPARFALPLPDHPGESLALSVALIRDLRSHVPSAARGAKGKTCERWDADLDRRSGHWWDLGWVATPQPAALTSPKLIPIVTTAPESTVIELVQTYTHRWPAQENSIRDFLLELGLDTNHGYAKRRVENSEVAKRRSALEQRLANLQRWAEGARVRGRRSSRLYVRRCEETREQAKALYHVLNQHQRDLERQGVDDRTLRVTIKEEQRVADEEIAACEKRQWRAYDQCTTEYEKCERYCQQQREALRSWEDLAKTERAMFELDDRKDQVMTVLKLALVNLVLWTRDQYFPATYAQATWQRLVPFFRLPGRVIWGTDAVEVTLRSFNDRHLNQDLAAICARVSANQLCLPDGRVLQLTHRQQCALASCEGGRRALPREGQDWGETRGAQACNLASGE